MHRIDGTGATGENQFTEGDPTQAVPATTVTAAWLNAVQEEVATAIEDQGLALDKEDNGQLSQAIAASIQAAFDALPKSLGTTGYVTLPGGVIVQWGDAPGDLTTATFPLEFPTALLAAYITDVGSGGFHAYRVDSVASNNTTLTYACDAGTGGGKYLAIGY
jgi:hypothetical protein